MSTAPWPFLLVLFSFGISCTGSSPETTVLPVAKTQSKKPSSAAAVKDGAKTLKVIPAAQRAGAQAEKRRGCVIENETTSTVDLIDTVIGESIGTIAPGETGSAGGHFQAKTAEGLTASGFCSVGVTLRVLIKSGKLVVTKGGTPRAPEGVGN